MNTLANKNPFVGPRPIGRSEKLYGRDTEVRELFHRLQARRIVVLHSPSGAGKSSLVAAGLIPKLEEARFDVWKTIRVNLDPGELVGVPSETNRYLLSTLLSLEEELAPERRRSPAELANLDLRAYLQSRPRRKGRADRPVVLIFDQLEEALTVAPRALEQKREFFTSLGRALDDGDTRALFVIREDYLGAFAPYRDRVPTGMAYTFRLDLLGLDSAREAAVALARDGGRSFPGVDHLITELSTVSVQRLDDDSFVREQGLYVEPVQLQVVCHRVWEAMAPEDTSIDAEDIGSSEDVSKALGGYYAASVARIAAGSVALERRLRDWVGNQLIVSGIRSQVQRGKDQTKGLDNALIEKLKDSYLVRSDTRAGATWYKLSHDRLVAAVTDDNQAWDAAHLHAMQVQARLWVQGERSPALLLSAGALPEAATWAQQNDALLTEDERKFLAISAETRAAEARARRRSRVLTAVLAVLVVLALGAMLLAQKAREAADQQAIAADRQAAAARLAQEEAEEARIDADEEALNAQIASEEADIEREEAERQAGLAEEARTDAVKQASAAQLAKEDALAERDRARIATAMASARELLALNQPLTGMLVLNSITPNARGWWELLRDLAGQLGEVETVLASHTNNLRFAAWSPDGTHILTASDDGTAWVWRADGSGAAVVLKGHTDRVNSAEWSPDRTHILTASNDGTARVWLANGMEERVLESNTDTVNSAAWSPDGKHIVTALSDGTARVWSANGTEERVLKGHTDLVGSAAWSRNGTHILTVSYDGTARVWRADGTGETVVLGVPGYTLISATWNPDGTRILTLGPFNLTRVWRVDGAMESELQTDLTRHQDLASATWSPDGTRILIVSNQGSAHVWSADGRGTPLVLTDHTASTDYVASAAWSPDGTRILIASSPPTVTVWSADGRGKPLVLAANMQEVLSAAWSPDGTRVLTASADDTARVWSADRAGEPVLLADREVYVNSAAWSPDGARIVTASNDDTAWVWRADGTGLPVKLADHEGPVNSAAWSPDGTRIVTASQDKTARVWRADGTGRPVVLAGHGGPVNSAAWSPDGTRIVTAVSRDETARIWRADGTMERVLGRPTYIALSAAWSPDGTRIVTTSYDFSLLWSADGTGLPVKLDHEGAVTSAAWSPDSTRIVTCSTHGTALVWSADGTGEPLELISGQGSPCQHPAWSPDGTRVLTASGDGTARVWRTPEALLALVPPLCLSPRQRELYLVEDPSAARANYESCERSHGRTPLEDPPDI